MASGTVTVTTDFATNSGFGYVTIDAGTFSGPATAFRLAARAVAGEPGICAPNCPIPFGASEIRYTIEVPATDTVAPFITVPESVRANATSSGGARVSYATRITDNVDPAPDLSCDPASGSVFPIGTTTVVCTGRDASGNTATKSFEVRVNPFPDRARDSVVGFGSVSGVSQKFDAFAVADADGGNPSGSGSGSGVYNFEARTVCLNVVGNRATAGAELNAGNPLGRGLLVSYVDNGDEGTQDQILSFSFLPEPPTSCPPPPTSSESALNVDGDIDIHDATSDTTPPTLNVPQRIATNATGPSGAKVTYTASATDNVDPAPAVSCNPASGSTFPIGTTKVTCKATDKAGNETTKAFDVVVRVPTSKEQCKNSGWRNYGTLFKNQGDCVSFVATRGKNAPAG